MCNVIRFVTQAEGFSEAIIDRFFRPFLGGIFFDNQLRTSSRLTSFVMRMLATGSNCLPAQGIGAITEQLASRLPADSIRLGRNPSQKLSTRGIRRDETLVAGMRKGYPRSQRVGRPLKCWSPEIA